MYNLVHRAMIQRENKQRTKQNLDFLSLRKTQINDFFFVHVRTVFATLVTF